MDALEHQRAALDEIIRRARAYYAGDWHDLPIQPRWASLICGPTGSGKTAVAAMAAAKLSETTEATKATTTVSLCMVSAPSWMPLGAHNRGTKETVGVIAEHVAHNDRTILFIDEAEKIMNRQDTSWTSWSSFILGELFQLADGRWPTGLTLPETEEDMPAITIEALSKKLRDTVFILAAGTFQSWYDDSNSRRSIGFGAEINPVSDELTAEIIAERMPRELANRFNSAIIRIPELQPADYHRIALEAETKLPAQMREAYRAAVQRHLPGAIAAKKGVRYLEEAMMEVLKNLPPKHHSKNPEPIPEPTP